MYAILDITQIVYFSLVFKKMFFCIYVDLCWCCLISFIVSLVFSALIKKKQIVLPSQRSRKFEISSSWIKDRALECQILFSQNLQCFVNFSLFCCCTNSRQLVQSWMLIWVWMTANSVTMYSHSPASIKTIFFFKGHLFILQLIFFN